MDDQKQALILDLETIAAVNAMLLRLSYGNLLENIHGTVVLDIVRGEFHEIKVAESFRCKKQRKKKIA